jgi:hypothetical protein
MRARVSVLAVLLLLSVAAARAEPGAVASVPLGWSGPRAGSTDLAEGWRHVAFPSIDRQTSYALVASGTESVLHAVSENAASFVVRRAPAGLDLERTPLLRWDWRVDRTILAGNGKEKATDDFAARVWVGFEGDWSQGGWSERRAAAKQKEQFGFEPPFYWIHYVWAGRGRDRDDAFGEPYSPARFRCLALRTAEDALGRWTAEERDPRADFKRLFGSPAPAITALAVMTDTDDTGSTAEAYYGAIAFVATTAAPAR